MTNHLIEDSDPSPSPFPFRNSRDAASAPPRPAAKVIRVLLVDGNPHDAHLLRHYLEMAPDHLRFEMDCATRLLDGQAKLARKRYDVALVSLWLPDSHGLATYQRLRDQSPDTAMVVLTSDADEEAGLAALRHGAEDYLVKGTISPNTLIRSLRLASERSRRRHAEHALRVSDAKMLAAGKIQQRLFPNEAPQLPKVVLDGCPVAYDISGASFPAEAIGGDYYDYVPMMHGSLGLVVGDVSGHGFGPALLMVGTRAHLRALAQTFDDVSSILAMTNRVLMADISDDVFVTLFLGQLDILTGVFSYASAGHANGYVLDGAGKLKRVLGSTALPLGIASDTRFPTGEPIQLAPGDNVVLFTDGVLEARSPDNESFGSERALAVVRHYLAESACQVVDNLYHAVRAFTQSNTQDDDITALVLKVKDLDESLSGKDTVVF